jgi:eukaryotic-like serine/threonine-protein kinase
MIGTKLSHYNIEGLLGRGGMGEVYRAQDERLGRSVAIKILVEGSEEKSESVRRFFTEAKAASALNHPNIVTVHDFDQDGAVHFIVMERIAGSPLSSRGAGPMPLDRFFDLALQITGALGAAHEAGIVHRDIKPANIMVTESGLIKIVDFGLARLGMSDQFSSDGSTVRLTSPGTTPGTILGTVGYMSPEQVQGMRATQRSDVFSVGVLFFEMLSGKSAFPADSPIATLAAILKDTPPSLDTLRNDLPPALVRLVRRCLATDPEARYGSAAEIHAELLAMRAAAVAAGENRGRRLRFVLPAAILLALIAAGAIVHVWFQQSRQQWVRNTAVPEIERLLEAEDHIGAFVLARKALAIAPDDPQLLQSWANLTFPVSITSEPPGAEIAISSYREEGEWIVLGTTPIENTNTPFAVVRYRASLPGYATTETTPDLRGAEISFRLFPLAEVPEGMVAVAGGSVTFRGVRATVPDFWIDQFEVTNAEYKTFVEAGGYRRAELWKHPFVQGVRTLSHDEAMAQLVDQTGRPGPSSWELGTFPPGREQHPVEGISWYEAAAYAEFAGKSLPTVFHWKRAAANDGLFADILTVSNFSGREAAPVGTYRGLGEWGAYDMAGNVKEWCFNSAGEQRYLLGGAWYDASYHFRESEARGPMDREKGFGLRLIRQEIPLADELVATIEPKMLELGPVVDDTTFAVHARLFDYDPIPLEARLEATDDAHALWRKETVSYRAAYGGERITAYLFIPKNARPPYQTVVVFPGSDAVFTSSSRHLGLRLIEFHIRSGRVLVYPVYKGTYERQVQSPAGPVANRDLRIQRTNDVRRTMDYLETRHDVDRDRIAYYGVSLGGAMAPYVLALESRFRCALLFGGILTRAVATPEVEPQNFQARVRLPVLYVAGRDDFMVPFETAQREYFDLLGTPPAQKRHYVFEGGHVPTQFNDVVREMLQWLDEWMGPVETR